MDSKEFYVNGQKENRRLEWQDDTLYEIVYLENTMQVIFLEDKNLSTIFIETQSGNNELIRASKENVEKDIWYLWMLWEKWNMAEK